jgi:hypothetical protein
LRVQKRRGDDQAPVGPAVEELKADLGPASNVFRACARDIAAMTSQPPRSRLLLMPEIRPAGPRPKVRRYRLVRVQGNQLRTVGTGFEHSKTREATDHPCSFEEG